MPPKGQKITDQRTSTARSRSCATASTSSASPSPRSASRARTRSSSSSPGVHDPNRRAELIGKTAQLELYDLEADLTGPSIGTQRLRRFPIATASLYNLLAGQQAKAKTGTPTAYYLFDKNKKLIAGPTDTRERRFNAKRPTVPKGGKVFAVPEKTVVITCAPTPENVCPGATRARRDDLLLPLQVRPDEPGREQAHPGDDGRGPEVVGTRPTSTESASRSSCSRSRARASQRVPADHAQPRPARPALEDAAALRDRARRRDQVVPADRLHRPVALERDQRRRPDHGHRLLRRGEGPRARPPDRRPAGRVQADRALATSRRRSARTRCKQAKTAALIGLLVVALFLLIFYRFLGVIAVIGLGDLRRLPLRRDPAPQRHADAAGLRRPDPDDRRRGRRERRHLRTHQGRGAVREVHPRRDRERLPARLPHDRRRERRHGASPRSCCSRSRPRR